MSEYFAISGYWKDNTNDTFEGYIVKNTHEVIESEDDRIFFYGMSEKEIIQDLGKETAQDFVITRYESLGNSI